MMRQIRKYLIPVLLMLLAACHTADEQRIDSSSEYFPLQISGSWIYAVSEIVYDTTIQNKNFHYQEKFEIANKFSDQTNEDTYVMYRSTRTLDTNPWVYVDTWSAKISNMNELIVNEGNIPYLKILLPVRSGSSWKGNKYNTIEASRSNGRIDNFTIEDFQKPYGEYDNTIKVVESNDVNLSYVDIRYSIYAKNIGLVYSINNYVEFCDDDSCFGLKVRKHEVTKIKTLMSDVVD